MTPLKFWRRKLPLTAVWVAVCMAMTVFLSTGFSLFYTASGLPDLVEKNNKTVALIGESHVVKEVEDGVFIIDPVAFTEKEYALLSEMDSVKDVHINKISGAYSESFYAGLPWEAYSSYQIGNSNEPYNNGILVGRVIGQAYDSETDLKPTKVCINGETVECTRRLCSVSFSVEKLYLFNDVFTDNVFSDFKFVDLEVVYYSADDTPLFESGDRCIVYIDNYRYRSNGAGPSATCLTGNLYGTPESGLNIIRRGDELISFSVDGAEYETVKVPAITTDGSEVYYEREELTMLEGTTDERHIPIMSKLGADVKLEDFLESPENGGWQMLPSHLETVNGCLPVVGTDCLEGQYAFVTDRAKIVEGRAFTEEEYQNGERVLVISRAVAEKGGVKAGDTVKLSQFLLDRESGRTDDFSVERGYYYHDYTTNINPTVGSYVTTPKFATEDELFTVVGIYDQSEEWVENMFAFSPNTVFMPAGAQTEGAFGGLDSYDGDGEPIRAGAAGVGLVVEIKNGMMDDFRREVASSGVGEAFLVFDQGYEESIIPARLLASMGRSLFLIVFCGWVILLVLYVLLYQLKQNRTLGIMRSVGVTPAAAGLYVFVCSFVPASVGVSAGCGLGMLLVESVQNKIFSLILSGGDMAGESIRFSLLLSQNAAEPAALIPAALVQIGIFAAVLAVCAITVASRPPRSLSSD